MTTVYKSDSCWKIVKEYKNKEYYYSLSCPNLFVAKFDQTDLSILYTQLIAFDHACYPKEHLWAIFILNDGYFAILLSEFVSHNDTNTITNYQKILSGEERYCHISLQKISFSNRFSRIYKENGEPVFLSRRPNIFGFYGNKNSLNPKCLKHLKVFYTLTENKKFDIPVLSKGLFNNFRNLKLNISLPTIILKDNINNNNLDKYLTFSLQKYF